MSQKHAHTKVISNLQKIKNRFCLSTHALCVWVERSEESAEIVDLHVRRLVRAFVDCKSSLRTFTISLNKMTMGNKKTTDVSLFDTSFFWHVDVLW